MMTIFRFYRVAIRRIFVGGKAQDQYGKGEHKHTERDKNQTPMWCADRRVNIDMFHVSHAGQKPR